jgi:thiamine pyrophosphate-dependent acetolactate synthase large subunit-like protein|tara:strand:+ start:277 stop:471 length:195 start_codon:yes stop_codon:yes gene_type:complete
MTCFPSNPIIEVAAKEGIRIISFRHELGAVMAADSISSTNARQKFRMVAIQSQAGAENAMGDLG